MPRIFLLIIFLYAFTFSAASQKPFRFFYEQTYGQQEGLRVDDGINNVYCDSKGFVWICTANGLYRFSGTLFKKFPVKKTAQYTLPAANVRFFVQDKNGKYFLSADKTGLSTYDDATCFFTPFELYRDTLGLKDLTLTACFFDKDNKLWLAAAGRGIICINTGTHRYRFYDTRDPKTGNDYYVSAAWVNCITQLRNGDILAGTNAGVVRIDKRTGVITHYIHPCRNMGHVAGHLYEDEDGSWWMATWAQGLLHYLPATGKWEQFFIEPGSISNTHNILHSVLYKSRNELWVGSRYGLQIFNKAEKRFYPTGNILYRLNQPDDAQKGLIKRIEGWNFTKDRAGNLWGFDQKKLYKVKHSGEFFPYTFVPFGKTDNPAAFTFNQGVVHPAKKDSYLLSASFGNGLYEYNGVSGQSTLIAGAHAPRAPYHINFSFLKDHHLWLCTESGLFDYDGPQQKFVPLPGQSLQAFTQNRSVSSIALSDSFIWVGAGPLYKYNRFSGKTTKVTGDGTEQLPDVDLYQLMCDKQNNLWVTYGGYKNLYCIRAGTGKVYNYSARKEISTGVGSSITQSPGGDIFFASRGNGLYKIAHPLTDSEKISQFTTAEGLPSDRIHHVFCDAAGYLWLSASNGLSICRCADMQFFNFGLYNGFPETDYWGMPSQLDSARFLLPLKYGYTIVNRDSLLNKPLKIVPVVIQKFLVNGKSYPKSIDYGGQLNLTYKENNFSIDFSALCFDDAEGIGYYYQLSGLNKDTVNISSRTNLTLYSIPPGSYTLSLFARERNKPFLPAGYTLHFVIHPPYWKTWWFTALCVIAIMLSLYFLYRYRVRQLLKLYKVRNSIAQDLHDDVGSTMTTISILSDVAKQQLENGRQPVELMDDIGTNSRQLLDKLDDIVWSVNPKNDSLDQFELRIKQTALDLLDNKGVKVNFNFSEGIHGVNLPMQRRRNIYLISKEALHNVSKYASASVVDVDIKKAGGRLTMIIRDNGKGFDPGMIKNGNGLTNMQERARQCGGSCTINSIPGKGTAITLQVPL